MHGQLEARVVAGFENVDLHVVGVVDEAPRHEDYEVAELEVSGLGLATAGTGFPLVVLGALGALLTTGTDDNLRPRATSRIVHRPDRRSAGNGRLSLRTARPLTERTAPTTQIRITVLF